jgi:hypothetical protein
MRAPQSILRARAFEWAGFERRGGLMSCLVLKENEVNIRPLFVGNVVSKQFGRIGGSAAPGPVPDTF